MKSKSKSEAVVRDIKRKTRRKYSSEEKIRIVLEGLRGEESIAVICRREGINANIYYRWSKDFLEAGKKRLQGDTIREANSKEVNSLRNENSQLKSWMSLAAPSTTGIVTTLNMVTKDLPVANRTLNGSGTASLILKGKGSERSPWINLI